MTLARYICLVLLLGVNSLGFGLLIVRRWRWKPLERLCAAAGFSLGFVYVAGFAIYQAGLDTRAYWGISAVSGALLLGCRGDLRALWQDARVRRTCTAFGALFAWGMLLLALVRHYSGGGWLADWLEHFERAKFFLLHAPLGTTFLGNYSVTARPPMMNILAAALLGQVGLDFDLFQITFLYLNLLVFLSCSLIAGLLVRRPKAYVMPLLLLFMASPMVMHNATYTWTKLLTVFYVILSVWFYVRGWQKDDMRRATAGFVFACLGLLVHYSAGPYLVFLTVHYLATIRKRKQLLKQTVIIAACSTLALSTWFGWSIAKYGTHSTVASNTSVTSSQAFSAIGNLQKIGANYVDTIVPYVFRTQARESVRDLALQVSTMGTLRDYTFLLYQTNLILAMGSVGGLLVLWVLARNWSGRNRLMARFWVPFIASCSIVGIVVVGERDAIGVAHLCLQPLVLLGITLLAASLAKMGNLFGLLALGGAALDFALGVFLQFSAENVAEALEHATGIADGKAIGALSLTAVSNYFGKKVSGLTFVGDRVARFSSALQVLMILGFALPMLYLVLEWLRAPAGRSERRVASRTAAADAD